MASLAELPARRPLFGPRGGPTLLGVINATPDSLWSGSRHMDPADAARTARRMVQAGAGAIDVGAASSRPGAAPVPADVERERLLPVLAAVRAACDRPLSVDTASAAVARAALAEGADAVNDVTGFSDPDMPAVIAAAGAAAILVASDRLPAAAPDPVGAVAGQLAALAQRAVRAGVPRERLVCDPGFGFGKGPEQNLALVAGVTRLRSALGMPVCVGPSRKGTVSAVLGGRPVARRLWGTAALVALAAAYGADLLRVHDVERMADVARIAAAVGPPPARALPAPGRIAVRGLRLEGRHGVLAEERLRSQPFVVDMDLAVDIGPAGRSDHLEDTLDYAAAAAVAAEVVGGPHRDLIERLAADIAAGLERRFPGRLLGGYVTVHKPEAPVGLPVADVSATWPLPSGAGGAHS